MKEILSRPAANRKDGDIMGPSLGMRLTALSLLSAIIGLAFAHSALAAAPAVLATGRMAQIPTGDLIFRVVDLSLEPGDSIVSHKHGAGMTYAVGGPNVLTLDGKSTTLSPGQALWVGDQVMHSHATDGKARTHFLFMYLWPESSKGAPMAPGFRDAKIAFESDVLTFGAREAQDVVLADNAYAAGEDSGMQSFAGPTLLSVQSGQFTLRMGANSRPLQGGDFAMIPPGTPVQVKADAAGHLLAESIVASGQPVMLPQTGGSTAELVASLAALIGLLVLTLAWIVRRRGMRAIR